MLNHTFANAHSFMSRCTKEAAYAAIPKAEHAYLDAITERLHAHMALKELRYTHSLGVATTATALALFFNEDPTLAYLGGLLHDWEKAHPTELQLSRARRYDLRFEVELEKVAPLVHGPLAAKTLPEEFPELLRRPRIQELLHAIAVHTTAAVHMSTLDKILYSADYLEPNRPNVGSIAQIRSELDNQFAECQKIELLPTQDQANISQMCHKIYLQCLSASLSWVLTKQAYVYPESIIAYNHALESL